MTFITKKEPVLSNPNSKSVFVDLGKPKGTFIRSLFMTTLVLTIIGGMVFGFWSYFGEHLTATIKGTTVVSMLLLALNVYSYSSTEGGDIG